MSSDTYLEMPPLLSSSAGLACDGTHSKHTRHRNATAIACHTVTKAWMSSLLLGVGNQRRRKRPGYYEGSGLELLQGELE